MKWAGLNLMTSVCLQDTRQSENVLSRLEVYIPVEAEVKSIPLRSLPASVLRRMELRLPASDAGRKPANSPEGIWICPALIRRKGVRPASRTGSGVMENMSSVLGTEFRAASGTFRMSFVSSNRAATEVLKETVPGIRPSPPAPLPHSPAPLASQDAVVIYNGRIYLSIRKPGRNRVPLPDAPPTGPPETHRRPDAPPTGPPETHRRPDAPPTGPPETHRRPDAPPTGPPASHFSSKHQPKEREHIYI
ncbi:uncharacterized protein [Brachyistius frenatus]|uniref:uncharacterized protein isoform X1 n=1 Tax=Brachyistius frenatus TaxID=100188 RepID=UPI0037E9C2CD